MSPHRPPAHSSRAVEDQRTGSLTLPRGSGPVRSYRRRDLEVDIRQVTQSNAADVANWCSGSVLGRSVRVKIDRAGHTFDLLAGPGDFVVRDALGYDVLTPLQFATVIREVAR